MMIFVSKFMVHRPLSDKTYLSLGLLIPLMRRERGSKYHYMRAIIGQPAKRHLNDVSLDGGPTLNAALVALWFYRGSGPVLLRK